MPGFSTIPDSVMLRLVPEERLATPVFAVTARDYKSERYRAFERFMVKEFSHVMATFGAGA